MMRMGDRNCNKVSNGGTMPNGIEIQSGVCASLIIIFKSSLGVDPGCQPDILNIFCKKKTIEIKEILVLRGGWDHIPPFHPPLLAKHF